MLVQMCSNMNAFEDRLCTLCYFRTTHNIETTNASKRHRILGKKQWDITGFDCNSCFLPLDMLGKMSYDLRPPQTTCIVCC